jgi:hypothetical protein
VTLALAILVLLQQQQQLHWTTTASSPIQNSGLLSSRRVRPASSSQQRWDPFPDLAKDYDGALRQFQLKQQRRRGMSSYTDLALLQANLHVVEPQPHGPLHRVYMCRQAAERFHTAVGASTKTTTNKKKNKSSVVTKNRVGLLLGTIQRERKEPQTKKPRTSLSSLPSDQEYCQVAKVHAIWEPPQPQPHAQHDDDTCRSTSDSLYDASPLVVDWHQDVTTRRVLELAKYLGLSPIGWIFTYSDDYRQQQQQQQQEQQQTTTHHPTVPVVLAHDVVTGAQLEMANIQYRNDDRIEGKKFVTLAMDATTGATEAFQLSDVSVQMVSEGLLLTSSSSSESDDDDDTRHGRLVNTKHAILVDGQETKLLDVWLCLINTALLSHKGDYCNAIRGTSIPPVTRKNKLTSKTKKALCQALDQHLSGNDDDDDDDLWQVLSDFHVLVALDPLLTHDEMQRLCQLVQKWVRGQKRGTRLDTNLQLKLKSVLAS